MESANETAWNTNVVDVLDSKVDEYSSNMLKQTLITDLNNAS